MLLANELSLLSADATHARPANGLAFRLKLLLAAGILPQLASCAACGEAEGLRGSPRPPEAWFAARARVPPSP